MDTNRWKSVAVKIDDYAKLKVLGTSSFRSPVSMISFLLDQHLNKNN